MKAIGVKFLRGGTSPLGLPPGFAPGRSACVKFIGSNLVIFVIKNLKNSRHANLLANRKSYLLSF